MSSTTTRQLFGGAVTVELPSDLVDVSTIRDVPDTQEVFVSPANASYVVELLQRAEPSEPKAAARFHFDALAHDNGAASSSVVSIDVLESSALPPDGSIATQQEGGDECDVLNSRGLADTEVEKAGEGGSRAPKRRVEDDTSVFSPVLLHGTQMVAKYNRKVPDEVQVLLALYRVESKSVDLVFTANLPAVTEAGDSLDASQMDEAKKAFILAARSLRIVDFSLFA